jgi:hypothetical protein
MTSIKTLIDIPYSFLPVWLAAAITLPLSLPVYVVSVLLETLMEKARSRKCA